MRIVFRQCLPTLDPYTRRLYSQPILNSSKDTHERTTFINVVDHQRNRKDLEVISIYTDYEWTRIKGKYPFRVRFAEGSFNNLIFHMQRFFMGNIRLLYRICILFWNEPASKKFQFRFERCQCRFADHISTIAEKAFSLGFSCISYFPLGLSRLCLCSQQKQDLSGGLSRDLTPVRLPDTRSPMKSTRNISYCRSISLTYLCSTISGEGKSFYELLKGQVAKNVSRN